MRKLRDSRLNFMLYFAIKKFYNFICKEKKKLLS